MASFSTPRTPEGVMAQPSAPQFWSSQAVISEQRWPRPPGGTADPDPNGEAPLGHGDHFAWVAAHLGSVLFFT
jgi:hypothetical protein